MKITKDMNLGDLMDKYPQLEPVLEDFGLTCAGCPGSDIETVEEAAQGHSVDLVELLRALNRALGELEK